MTFALTAALILTVIAFVVLLDRKDKRAHDKQERHDKQVERLCQRIQAPESAVVEHATREAAGPPGAPPMSDDEYWDLPQEHQEFIARMEAMENAPFERE